jgi:hypothetical protein
MVSCTGTDCKRQKERKKEKRRRQVLLALILTICASFSEMVGGGKSLPDAVYGFIGLGNMGYGMAQNLRASMPKECKLVVCELNTRRRDEFIAANKAFPVELADCPRSIAEQCVGSP